APVHSGLLRARGEIHLLATRLVGFGVEPLSATATPLERASGVRERVGDPRQARGGADLLAAPRLEIALGLDRALAQCRLLGSQGEKGRIEPRELRVDRLQGRLPRRSYLGGLGEPSLRRLALRFEPRGLAPRLLGPAGFFPDRRLLAIHLAREPVHLVARGGD